MSYALNENKRRSIIIEYIKNNPDCNKQKVVNALDGQLSRVPILHTLKELKKEGIISESKEKQNSRDHKLNVNAGNIVVSVSQEIDELEKAFFSLFKSIKKKYDAVYSSANSTNTYKGNIQDDVSKIVDLLWESSSIFYEIVNVYLLRSVILWPKKVQDKDVLKKLYSIVYTKIADISLRLSEVLKLHSALDYSPLFYTNTWRNVYATENFAKHVKLFKDSNMEKESELLLNSIWNVYDECKESAFPEPRLYAWNYNFNEGWKKFVELHMKNPKQTYDNYKDYRLNFHDADSRSDKTD